MKDIAALIAVVIFAAAAYYVTQRFALHQDDEWDCGCK